MVQVEGLDFQSLLYILNFIIKKDLCGTLCLGALVVQKLLVIDAVTKLSNAKTINNTKPVPTTRPVSAKKMIYALHYSLHPSTLVKPVKQVDRLFLAVYTALE